MTVINLSTLDGADGFRLQGISFGDNSGRSVSGADDVNGDGFADIIVGSRNADPGGKSNAGETYVEFGKASGFTAGVDLSTLEGPDGFRLDGIDAEDTSGFSVSGAGDLNGDGFADLVIGARGADPNTDSNAGETYVVFGKAAGFTASLDLGALDGADGFRLDGIDAVDRSGTSVSGAGDVNGDGFADLIIGANQADPNLINSAGESYVVFGKAGGFTSSIDLAALDGANGFRLDGSAASDLSGFSVSGAGDVNGDGFADLIIGANNTDPNGDSNAGETYIVYGKAAGFAANLDLGSLDGADGFQLDGANAFDASGIAVSDAGDVNGDGFDDLIVGAAYAAVNGSNLVGESYVVFGFDSGAVTHQGTDFANKISGDSGANVMIGGLGNDRLIGAGGLDVLRGGGGDDALVIADLGFRQVHGGAGTDALSIAGNGFNLDFTAVGSQLVTSIEAIELAGFGAKTTLDRLSIVNLSEASNSVAVEGSTNERLILADEGWSLTSADGATHTFANGAATVVVESTLSRDVTGSALADTLLGGDGDDNFVGGGGNDAITGGDGEDTADYSGAAGFINVNLITGATQDGDGGTDTLTSIENVVGTTFNDIIIGNASVNTLTGGDGVDRLDGRGGDDVMIGGDGNDIYTVSDVGDVVTERASEGTDRINTSVDFTNPDNVELLVGKFSNVGLNLTGNAARDQITGANKINSPDAIFGLGGNDTSVGLVGNDVINGGSGNDRIFGPSGLDVIDGGAGNDRVTGQQGADTFVFGFAEGRDTITDFNGAENVIDLSAHGFADFAAVLAATTDVSGSAVINFHGLHNLKIQGVLEATLAADDFILA